MIYKYVFHSPLKYRNQFHEIDFKEIKHKFSYNIINYYLRKRNINISDIISIQLSNIFGKTLKTRIYVDHILSDNELNRIYTYIQHILYNIKEQCLDEKDQIYCLLWHENNWELKYLYYYK